MNCSPLRFLMLAAACVTVFAGTESSAQLIIDPAQPITHVVTVNPIIVSDDGGANTATYFGNATQEAAIKGFVDDIWAQAGIDVQWKATTSWNSTFALSGTPGSNNPRPTSDLSAVVSAANSAGGILDSDPNVLNMFFVEIAAGFSQLGNNSAAGLAFVNGNGVTQYVGGNLPGFTAGQEVIASVVAHEIGHNLGLPHITEAENLMQAGGSPNQGERLNAAQIQIALADNLSVPIPEPSTLPILAAGIFLLARRRRRAA